MHNLSSGSSFVKNLGENDAAALYEPSLKKKNADNFIISSTDLGKHNCILGQRSL